MSSPLDLERLKQTLSFLADCLPWNTDHAITEKQRVLWNLGSHEAELLSAVPQLIAEVERLRGEVALLKRQAQADILKTASIGFEGALPLGHKASIEDAEYWLSVQIDRAKAVGAAEELERVTRIFSPDEWNQIDTRALLIQLATQIRKKVTL